MNDSLFSTSGARTGRHLVTVALAAVVIAGTPLITGAQDGGTVATGTARKVPLSRPPQEQRAVKDPARAGTSSAQREQMMQERTQVREERAEELEARREEKKEQLKENAKKRIRAHLERMIKRFRAALERLTGIADRLASRLDKMTERGIDVSQARTLLAQARTAIAAAEEAVNTLPATLDTILQGTGTPREMFTELQSAVQRVKESITAAHKALVEALKATKANVRTGTATTTP